MNCIQHLEVPFELNGVPRIVNPTLIWDDTSAVLIDAGFPGQAPAIRRAIEAIGIAFNKIDMIVVTHLDWDHIGGLADMVTAGQGVEVLAHELEQPFIQGDKVFVKAPQRNAAGTAQGQAPLNFPRTRVTKVVGDGDVIDVAGGIDVIHTPGHTLGHICLYHRHSKTLIAGDALNVVDGKLTGPNPIHTHDMKQGHDSLRKLANYDIRTVICYHGGVFNDDTNARIAELARYTGANSG